MQRRQFLQATAGVVALGSLASLPIQAAEESPLIYLSTVKSDGDLSSCQAEVWYVQDGADMYVVTDASAWRAKAVRQGLTQTKVWVGDVGLWKRSNGAYKALPNLMAAASFETNGARHAALLAKFGNKYSPEWPTWGPRFRDGLANGSRVMLKYTPV